MILKEMHLSNFRSYEDEQVRFGAGVNLILGTNAAGKSSLLDAISIALFGSESEEYGANEGEGYTIDLTFNLGAKEYRLVRSAGAAELSGDLTISGEEAVNKWVERFLVPSGTFDRIFYVRDPPRERRAWIGETTDVMNEALIHEAAEEIGASIEEIEPCVNDLFNRFTGDSIDPEVSIGSMSVAKAEALEVSIRLGLALWGMKRKEAPLLVDRGFMNRERLGKLADASRDILGRKPQIVIASQYEELSDAADKIVMITQKDGASHII